MVRIIIIAALITGTLDIVSAFIDYSWSTGKNPLFILNYIASGVFGNRAFAGGLGVQLAGLLFHFIICFCITIVFFLVCKQFPGLLKYPLLTALLVAILAWIVTNPLLFPLTNLPRRTVDWSAWPKILKAIAILVVTIGLPLAYIGRYYFNWKNEKFNKDLPVRRSTEHPL